MDILSFWGKKTDNGVHPLLYHMIDTANIAVGIWKFVLQEQMRGNIASILGVDEDYARKLVTFWAGLHDLGKVDKGFQKLKANREPHGFWTSVAIEKIFPDNQFYKVLSQVLGGHHGYFPRSRGINYLRNKLTGNSDFANQCKALTKSLALYLGIPENYCPELKARELSNAIAMILAGLVSTSDWIASNEDFFGYENGLNDIDAYNKKSVKLAHNALEKVLHWTQWQPADNPTNFKILFPKINNPRPLQQRVIDLCKNFSGPSLVIIEAPTGEGKSEAAMLLADYFSTSFKQKGIYFALPTQATSNQMFGRIREFLKTRYDRNIYNLMLQHGHACLNEEFSQIKNNSGLFSNPILYDTDERSSAGPIAASWFTYRKRGLLAPFGVGTIDQILLAALQTKHFFVRLYGLAGKTIIIDEAHAYDTYMVTLLERLLKWLAAMNCCVIILSATLPKNRCVKLIEAFKNGRSQNNLPGTTQLTGYPRISWCGDSSSGSESFLISELNRKSYHIRWVDGGLPESDNACFPLGKELRVKLKDGGCTAVICNTVRRCQKVYSALKKYFPDDELYIFHARYLFKDRRKREEQTLKWFGKNRSQRPKRQIIVATQVIEQSLDIDFDLMVTDMAPIDFILQRAGRLHRHAVAENERFPNLRQPQLWICQPESEQGGVPTFDSGTEAVYKNAKHILFRSWLALKDKKTIKIPDQTEELIEAAYDNRESPKSLNPEQKEYWSGTLSDMNKKKQEYKIKAESNAILPPDYEDNIFEDYNRLLEEDSPDIHKTRQALTRPMELPISSVIILYGHNRQAFYDNNMQEPVAFGKPDNKQVMQIINNTTNISGHSIAPWLNKNGWLPAGWKEKSLLRNYRVIFLEDGKVEINGRQIAYNSEIGILITKKD